MLMHTRYGELLVSEVVNSRKNAKVNKAAEVTVFKKKTGVNKNTVLHLTTVHSSLRVLTPEGLNLVL